MVTFKIFLFLFVTMNINQRILPPNQKLNVVHEGPKNMPQHLNRSCDVQSHQPSTNVCSNNVLNQSTFYTQLEDQSSLHNGMLFIIHYIYDFFLKFNYIPHLLLFLNSENQIQDNQDMRNKRKCHVVDKTLTDEVLCFNHLPYNNLLNYNPIDTPTTVTPIGTL